MIKFSPIDRTAEQLQLLWQKVSQLAAWSMDDSSSPQGLAIMFADQRNQYYWIWQEDEIVGYCALTGVDGRSANAHVLFFDKRVLGRGARLNRFAYMLMQQQGLSILRSITPVTHRGSFFLLQDMDWHEDGIIRHYIVRDGVPVDGALFSITKEELDGRFIRTQQAEDQNQEQATGATDSDSGTLAPVPDREDDAGGWETTDVRGVSGDATTTGDGTTTEPAVQRLERHPARVPRATDDAPAWDPAGFFVATPESVSQ